MKAGSISLFAAAMAVAFVATQGAAAHETKTPVSKSLMKTELVGMPGKEANIVLFNVGPGWKTAKHFHSGHVFVYMMQGAIELRIEGKPPRVLGAGDVLHEIPGRNMVATNISSTKGARFLVFQVGDIGKPLMTKAK